MRTIRLAIAACAAAVSMPCASADQKPLSIGVTTVQIINIERNLREKLDPWAVPAGQEHLVRMQEPPPLPRGSMNLVGQNDSLRDLLRSHALAFRSDLGNGFVSNVKVNKNSIEFRVTKTW